MDGIVVEGLTKSFGETEAVKALTFSVSKGELFGIIGPDGAGKSTLFRLLATLLLPGSGSASIDGFHLVSQYKEIRKQVGYMPGKFSLYQDLSVEENLHFFAAVFDTTPSENGWLIADIYRQLEPFRHRRAGALSGGMKQKLALCCALIHKPSLLLLDEPTTGVDPVSRKEFWAILRNLKQAGITILVSTPYMDEALLCERIALMQEGAFLQIGTPAQMIASYPETLWAVKASNMSLLLRDIRTHSKVKSCHAFGQVHHVTLDSDLSETHFRQYLLERGHSHLEMQTVLPGIEDCFMYAANTKIYGKE